MRYLAGTYETYGNTTTADSLTAIRKVVYEQKRLSLSELVHVLDHDYAGQEELRQTLLDCPKFGNGDPEADRMAQDINTFVFDTTARQAEKQGLPMLLCRLLSLIR